MLRESVERMCNIIGSSCALNIEDLFIFHKIDNKTPVAMPSPSRVLQRSRWAAGTTDKQAEFCKLTTHPLKTNSPKKSIKDKLFVSLNPFNIFGFR